MTFRSFRNGLLGRSPGVCHRCSRRAGLRRRYRAFWVCSAWWHHHLQPRWRCRQCHFGVRVEHHPPDIVNTVFADDTTGGRAWYPARSQLVRRHRLRRGLANPCERRSRKGLSEFLCARRYDLIPTGQDRVYPADGLPGKLVMLANRCSLVRSKHLFLRPDLPSPRQARASRVKSAAQRRDRSHAQPPLGGEHGEDPRFDAAEHDASLGQGGVS